MATGSWLDQEGLMGHWCGADGGSLLQLPPGPAVLGDSHFHTRKPGYVSWQMTKVSMRGYHFPFHALYFLPICLVRLFPSP